MRWTLAPLGVLLICGAGCPTDPDDHLGDDDSTGDDDDTTDEGWDPRFDVLVSVAEAELDASCAPGLSVAVMEAGEVTFARGFGTLTPLGADPVTPTTLFQIGSTTKMMTVTALLQKVEDAQVSLDATLAEALPALEFAQDGSWNDQIRVEHLITHQGGIADYVDWEGSSDDAELADFTYGFFADQLWLMNPPGVFWNYSNPNFSLAGLVTEELDERMWPDILVEDVLLPLGMDRTYLRKAEVEADGDFAESWGWGSPADSAMHHVTMDDIDDAAWVRPAGLAWSTPSQMVRFGDFLMHGDDGVLDDGLRAEMVAEQVNTLWYMDEMHYGYGVFVDRGMPDSLGRYQVTPVCEHGGNTLSFTSILYALPEYDVAVSILSSGYGTSFHGTLEAALNAGIDLPEPVEAPEYEFDPDRLDDHVGTYLDPYNVGEIVISREGDELRIEMPDLVGYGYDVDPALVTVSSDLFYVDIDGGLYDLTFIPADEGGASTYLRNRSFVGIRADAEPPPAIRGVVDRVSIDRALAPPILSP
jgi:CubicO group peptidase (beta-lactamase class C family)